jgi:hypothetical protein
LVEAPFRFSFCGLLLGKQARLLYTARKPEKTDQSWRRFVFQPGRPVASLLGCRNPVTFEVNMAIAKRFTPLPKNEMYPLNGEFASQKPSIDRFFCNEVDC